MPDDPTSVPSGQVLGPDIFLTLVNDVLKAVGREALAKGSAQQRIITVEPTDRVLQILAGPGSGKTEMLVWRVLFEIFVMGVPSQRVMVTTFTRRAATELQVRVVERSDALLHAATQRGVLVSDPKVHDLRVGTIHSLCDALLAEFDTTHVERGTQVIDETEVSVRIARDHRLDLGFNTPPKPPRVLNRLLSNPALTRLFRPGWDDNPKWPGSMMERVNCILAILNQHTETWLPRCEVGAKTNGIEVVHGPKGLTADLIKLQQRWEEYLDRNTVLDFATIQKRFLERQGLVADHLSHVFVDEFQDNNPIQFALHTGWLKRPGMRLTVVGDDDQAIYRFRGSDIECFNQLRPYCGGGKIAYRLEKLEVNYRSTQGIVRFTQRFREDSALGSLSMRKVIVAAPKAIEGVPIRLLEGPWSELSNCVADELKKLGAGRIPKAGEQTPPSAALLMFSTSERSSQSRIAPATTLRRALQDRDIRAYNPRSKMAGSPESPVSQLLGLISYLIDPICRAKAGKSGREIMVAASMNDSSKQSFALSRPPNFAINEAHLNFQKKFFKYDGGDVGAPCASRRPLVEFIDAIRTEVAKACASGKRPRLTLAGLISRLLAHPYFRRCGFTPNLFRQALFTELLEANIAPTRLTTRSLDHPLEVTRVNGRYQWPDQFWSFLNVFGAYLDNASIDDPEVETFEENTVLMLTFHQTKGLEFDHVYVAGTGRDPDLGPALRSKLFSGEAPKYRVNGALTTRDRSVSNLALADRDAPVRKSISPLKGLFGSMPMRLITSTSQRRTPA